MYWAFRQHFPTLVEEGQLAEVQEPERVRISLWDGQVYSTALLGPSHLRGSWMPQDLSESSLPSLFRDHFRKSVPYAKGISPLDDFR